MTTTRPARSNRRNITLRNAFAEFVKHPTPWMIATFVVGSLIARIVVGGWSWVDAAVPAGLLAISPLVEWLIHVGILHWRPRRIGKLTIDSLLAREHRAHHHNPRDIPLIFIPWPVLVWLLPLLTAIGLFAFGRVGLGLTFLFTVTAFLLMYEWTHYLIHTDYKPRSRLYRATWRNHRFHHYKNEHYWFTVTTTGTADRVLHTYPDPDRVEKSPTAKDLHAKV
ncbi:sterol desaturase family protein [Gordonia sp. CPCC 205333]|uniref:sterol desaturase family protein n=1 Tax=Gordonia sp. CPCC 205333 TaxID=3140790 RepID=UPI003AF3526A